MATLTTRAADEAAGVIEVAHGLASFTGSRHLLSARVALTYKHTHMNTGLEVGTSDTM